ncbi:extracellular solute-binding protein [Rhizobium sp. LC145]|jgi:multiple sugar transport system substrate-binding protein|uniref:extracellular solute-binding protein n=1 Tax=Rhizobium sp. LC145 TaxID=1120688 RepID=UPI00062A029B|nr:extracellular solute-binding protein [Rhizobium sp. LC145]KKX32931.1 sugar ABC transporter substrate-binding protein [Rhizobium sp. LC145]TKT57345.1 extracellular solute-binding protein [Rhizobiaceae bacterium LC148]
MRRILLSTAALIALTYGSAAQANTTIELQRFFGACDADYGNVTDVSSAVGECGIITALINKFEADNPDINVNVTTVEWPGYDQLNAQLASGAAPDVVSMHYSAISDYQSRGLIEPIDEVLASQGISPDSFTDAARGGVTKEGQIFGLPFDNWTMLFHVNLNLMKEAGLLNADGTPILPTSADELIAQGKQFKEKTGKPYLVQILANETASYARILYTLLQQQKADFFADPTKIKLNTPEAKAAVELIKRTKDEGITTLGLDYAAAVSAFANGDGGISVNGTWLIGDYVAQAEKAGTALSGGYTVYPVPQLFPAQDSTYADGHSWVMPKKDRSPEQTAAIAKLFKFLAENDFQWARTGHLPAVKTVFDMPEFKSLPHRENIAEIAETGRSLPAAVQRQFAIQDIIGDEIGAAVNGDKSIEDALSGAESRINDLLANI